MSAAAYTAPAQPENSANQRHEITGMSISPQAEGVPQRNEIRGAGSSGLGDTTVHRHEIRGTVPSGPGNTTIQRHETAGLGDTTVRRRETAGATRSETNTSYNRENTGFTGANENTENPWSSNSRAESMDTEEIRVMAEFPPLNQQNSGRRRRENDQEEREPGEIRENNRQRENRRSDPRLRQERPRIQVRDYVSSMIDRLSEPERRISDNQIKAGFIKLSKYEDPKVIDYFKNTVPLVSDQFTLSYILREGGRQSHQFIRTGENSVFLFIKNWSHPSTRAKRSSAKHLMIESEVLITDQATEDIVRVPNEEGPERDNPRCIYPELYGHIKIERSKHNGDCSCASSMLNFKTCALHAGTLFYSVELTECM
jgi:hypothetical protein